MRTREILAAALALGLGLIAGACSTEEASNEGSTPRAGAGGKGGKGGAAGKAGASGQSGSSGQGGAGACKPSCEGRYCGSPDGCGSSCTDCPSSSQICDAKTWKCVSVSGCQPSCAGKGCGQDDGCGGKCKICPQAGTVCDEASGACKPAGCQPSCEGKSCGQDDGCNGKCTTCPAGLSCNLSANKCEGGGCQPSCEGKGCGQDDGCGNPCTACADPEATCNTGVGACIKVCKPDCNGKSCGQENGCGGKCGGCPGGELCDTTTWSCKPPCKPSCEGKSCGDDDGCGGKCATCPEGQFCSPSTLSCEACTLSCAKGCVMGESAQLCRCEPGQVAQYDGSCKEDPKCSPGCGDHGVCTVKLLPGISIYSCACEPGYIDGGGRCVPERRYYCRDGGALQEKGTIRCSPDDSQYEVCRDVDGDGLQEWVASGSPSCPAGNTCSACKSWGCKENTPCPEGTLCVTKIHEQDFYGCVGASCDCSNCGTCNIGDFQGMQASCGGPPEGPATLACQNPCPPGLGCIPFTVDASGQHYPGICYPLEGCFGLPPG